MLTENDVVEAVAGHLEERGWEIIQTARTDQRGHDILALRDGISLAVEAKGETSSKDTPRRGQSFSGSQKRTHVAKALYRCARVSSEGRHRPGIALPSSDGHRKLVNDILPALKSLGVSVFLVEWDRAVQEVPISS